MVELPSNEQPCADKYALRDSYQAGNPKQTGVWKLGLPYVNPATTAKSDVALIWFREPKKDAAGWALPGREFLGVGFLRGGC